MYTRARRVLSRVVTGRPGCEVCGWAAGNRRWIGPDGRWRTSEPASGDRVHVFCSNHAPEDGSDARDLTGDRDVEWSYVSARVGRYAASGSRVLDFGAGGGFLSLAAGGSADRVLAIDLMPRQFPLVYPTIEFRQLDVMELPEQDEQFDVIMNCSTIEHVGLSGRYLSSDHADGDILAMDKLRRLLKPDGHMILTLPVGRDALFAPLHRIYGGERLPLLLEGYRVIESAFVRKDERNTYFACEQQEALSDEGNERYYAMGTMVLERDGD